MLDIIRECKECWLRYAVNDNVRLYSRNKNRTAIASRQLAKYI